AAPNHGETGAHRGQLSGRRAGGRRRLGGCGIRSGWPRGLVAAHLRGAARETRPGERPRRFAFGPARGRGRRGQLGLYLGFLGEHFLLVLAVEQREELLLLDRLALDEDLGDLFEVGAVFGEDVLRALVRGLDDAADLVVDLARDL